MSEPTEDVPDRNALARECADLRDTLEAERKAHAEAAERWAQMWAEVLLADGKTAPEVTDTIYNDGHRVLDALKDRVWWAGHLDGIRESRIRLDGLLTEAIAEAEAERRQA